MLHLIINEQGKPEHRWSIDPETDFKDFIVIGPAILNADGFPEDSAVLVLAGSRVTVDAAKKAELAQAAQAERDAAETKRQDREAAKERVKALDPSTLKDVAEIKVALADIRKLLV